MITPIVALVMKFPGIFAAPSCDNTFFGLPVWWKYLNPKPQPPNCEIKAFDFPDDIWPVLLAIIEMLLWLGGMVAVIMIIVGGLRYMTALGNAEKTVSARKTIVNSLIGLAIVVTATAAVSFLGKYLTS